MTHAFYQHLAKALDTALHFQPNNLQHMEPLEGKWVCIVLTDLNLTMVVGFSNKRVVIHDGTAIQQVDATIRARSVDLFLMALQARQHGVPSSGQGVHMSGDVAFAMAWRDLLAKVSIPLDRIAAHYLGEQPAYGLGTLLRAVKEGVEHVAHHVTAQSVGFVRDELGAVVTDAEVAVFSERVSDCRDRLARLEAKWSQSGQQGEQ